MHRLAVGTAGAPKNIYICTPCRLRLSLRCRDPEQTAPSAVHKRQSRAFTQTGHTNDDSSSFHVTGALATGALAKKQLDTRLAPVAGSTDAKVVPPGNPSQDVKSGNKDKPRSDSQLNKQEEHDRIAVGKILESHKHISEAIQTFSRTRSKHKARVLQHEKRVLEARIAKLEKATANALRRRLGKSSEHRESILHNRTIARKLWKTLLEEESQNSKSAFDGELSQAKTLRIKKFPTSEPGYDSSPDAVPGVAQPSRGGRRRRVLASSKKSGSELVGSELATLSSEQKAQIQQLLTRLTLKYAVVEDAESEDQQNAMLIDILAVITDRKVAEKLRGLLTTSVKNSHSSVESRTLDLSKHHLKGAMSIAEAMKSTRSREKRASVFASTAIVLGSDIIDNSSNLLEPIEVKQPPVRGLSYGLDRVLFNKGVYQLQDPRSRVFNFDPYLADLIPVQDFNFDLLPGFITSSKDTTLLGIAQSRAKRYTGSSSSMTGILSQLHYFLSANRELNLQMISETFPIGDLHRDFTQIAKTPASVFLRLKNDVYAIDSDKEFDTMNVLSLLGNSLEKLLTLDKEDYKKYRRDSTESVPEERRNAPETYHYTGLGDVLMRSQLDAHDPRLPGTGMFDLKTRAVFPIRMNVSNYHEGRDYELKHHFGFFESYEREYVDMLRATMMKYMLQVRIGRMDGIFVAFHNTQRIFGFQYMPLEEIDLAIHGQADRSLGDQEFRLSVKLMNEVMNKATEKFPNTSIRMLFSAAGGKTRPRLSVFAQPVTEEEADEIQHKNHRKSAAVTEEILAGKFPTYAEGGMRVIDYSVLANQSESTVRQYGVQANPIIDNSIANDHDIREEPNDGSGPVAKEHGSANLQSATALEVEPEINEPFQPSFETSAELDRESSKTLSQDEVRPELSKHDGAGVDAPTTATTPSEGGNGGDSESFDGDETFMQHVEELEKEAAELARSGKPLMYMELEVESSVNGVPVKAPGFGAYNKSDVEDNIARQADVSTEFSADRGDQWDVKYTLREYTDPQFVWLSYLRLRKNRSRLIDDNRPLNPVLRDIRERGANLSKKGKKWRAARDEQDKDRPVITVGDDRPLANASGKVEAEVRSP